jgi:hypothetical protein
MAVTLPVVLLGQSAIVPGYVGTVLFHGSLLGEKNCERGKTVKGEENL